MATDTTAGLFNTPEQYQQAQLAQQQANAIQMAQLTPEQRASAGMQVAGYQIGGGIGGALGAQDPQMKIASMRQQILQGVDQTNPQSMMEAAQKLAQAGDNQGAQQLAQAAREAALQLAKANQENTAATKNLREATPAAVREYQVAKAEGFPGSFVDFQLAMKKAAASQTNVSVENKGAAAGAVEAAQLDAKRLQAAQGAADKAIESAGILTQLENTPQGVSGAGAGTRVAALRVFDTVGLTSSTDKAALANADKFNSLTGERTLSFIKQLGTNPTDTDREFARTIGPAIEKGEKTNKDLIAYLRKRAQDTVQNAKAMETHFYKNNYSLRGYESPFASNLETPNNNAARLAAIEAAIAQKQKEGK
jgi:hypothetical protein